jgi:hypothetical protein
VGHVDNNAKPIARTHHRSSEICQTALHRVFGLDVAQFIRPVVNQLQMAHAVGDTHFVDALDLTLEKSAPSAVTMMDGPLVGAARSVAVSPTTCSCCSCASRSSRMKAALLQV